MAIGCFGTQLLCDQVIGRALRRQSYDLNEEGLFNVEYADVFGIPFDFTAKPVVAPPQPPRETIQVKAYSAATAAGHLRNSPRCTKSNPISKQRSKRSSTQWLLTAGEKCDS